MHLSQSPIHGKVALVFDDRFYRKGKAARDLVQIHAGGSQRLADGLRLDSLTGRVDGLPAERVKTGDEDLHEGNLRVLFPAHGKTKHRAAGTADDVHKVGYIVLHEQNIIYLLAQVERTDKDQSDRNTAVPAAGQTGQHDEHKHDAGGAKQTVKGLPAVQ